MKKSSDWVLSNQSCEGGNQSYEGGNQSCEGVDDVDAPNGVASLNGNLLVGI